MNHRRLLVFLWALVFGLIGHAAERDEVDAAWEQERAVQRAKDVTALTQLLTGVGEMEVMTLDPDSERTVEQPGRADSQPRLDRWLIRQKVQLKDEAQIAPLRAGLLRSIETAVGGSSPCFRPRHGIRFRKGGTEVALIVCFECGAMEIRDSSGFEGIPITPAAAQDFYLVFRKHGLTHPHRLGKTSDTEIAGRLAGTWRYKNRDKHSRGMDTLWDIIEDFGADGSYRSETKYSFVAAGKEPEEWRIELDHGTWRIEQGMLFVAGTKADGIVTRVSYERLVPLIELSENQVIHGSLEPGSNEEIVWKRK